MLRFEHSLWEKGLTLVAGVDEVGVGPLAGPVYAAAVILPHGVHLPEVNDSKKLSAKKRERLSKDIYAQAVSVAIGICSVSEIDTMNILQATREAMRRAVMQLDPLPEHVLVDARRIPRIEMGQTAIIKGDAQSQTIAAASIVAKVARDRLMDEMAEKYPGYGFEKHRGYGTALHMRMLQELGPMPEHRTSFAPVRRAMRGLDSSSIFTFSSLN